MCPVLLSQNITSATVTPEIRVRKAFVIVELKLCI